MNKHEFSRYTNNYNVSEYDSINEYVDDIHKLPYSKIFINGKKSSVEGMEFFTGTKSYEEAIELLKFGWSDGAKKLNTSLKIANKDVQSKEVKRAVYDVVGFQASVPRYLQGIPTSMVNTIPTKRKSKTVTIYKSIAYAALVDKDDILKDSVKFLQIIQEIEKQGIKANVYVIHHGYAEKEHLVNLVKVKSASERLNISKLAFPLMHPSFLRRIVFRSIETESRLKNFRWARGYGYPAKRAQTESFIKAMKKENVLFIPTLISEQEAINIVEGKIGEE